MCYSLFRRVEFLVTSAILVFATNFTHGDELQQIYITEWLKLGPIKQSMPVFSNIKNLKGETFDISALINFQQIDIAEWYPAENDIVNWKDKTDFKWQKVTADSSNTITISNVDTTTCELAFLAIYINAERWVKIGLEVSSPHLLQIWLDGKSIATKSKSSNIKDTTLSAPDNIYKDVELETGKHLLIVKTLSDPENNASWSVNAILKMDSIYTEDEISITISPIHSMNIRHLLYSPIISDISVSPGGDIVAVGMRQYYPPDNESESWLELRRVVDGSLLQTYRGGMSISKIQWSPIEKKFCYVSQDKNKNTLWLIDIDKGTAISLADNVENFGYYSWSPDGSFIIYSIIEKAPENKEGIKLLEGMEDRQPNWRDRSFLYLVNVPQGTKRRLTAGKLSTNLNAISPDGKKIVFTRNVEDYTERPYSKNQFFVLDIHTMSLDSLFTDNWASYVQWSPDGEELLILGGPSAFDGIGKNIPEDMIPNDYDTQAFLYDLKARKIDPITRDFDPQILRARWKKSERLIYFQCVDKEFVNLYRYDVKKNRFELMDLGFEALHFFDIAEERSIAVYVASSANVPPKAYKLNLNTRRNYELFDPGKDEYKNVVLSKVESWSFKNEQNVKIEGRIYYPPKFQPDRKYPCIVYYYGGTNPTSRYFDGRYPFNLYAANGYVVYVLQPSGATGYGQEFSALHVNDWGKIVADEIIDGVKKFLDAHSFIDRNRVGCIGASYGGFTTELLLSKTDIFSAAISHAGISSISSYWGEGYWGYTYSSIAAANSFPWNRRDIYLDQSPLFNADKINTPLLMTHGTSDTNVPPGESIQLYTALKLLGKKVELIQFEGENHTIANYDKRIKWTNSILAWFDKWLKNQPGWWNNLYNQN